MSSAYRRKLLIGIQTFSYICEGDYYYVNKTPFIERLANQNKYYFLSRPRRFGKSLLLDTLHCLFEGQESLFEGLYIRDRWNWQTNYPRFALALAVVFYKAAPNWTSASVSSCALSVSA